MTQKESGFPVTYDNGTTATFHYAGAVKGEMHVSGTRQREKEKDQGGYVGISEAAALSFLLFFPFFFLFFFFLLTKVNIIWKLESMKKEGSKSLKKKKAALQPSTIPCIRALKTRVHERAS